VVVFFNRDDRVFTPEQMMLPVIQPPTEKLDDENILFPFEYFFLILCKYLNSYEEIYVLKHFKKEL